MLTGSVGAHLLVLGVLAWRLGETPLYPDPRIMTVELAPLPAERRRPPPPVHSLARSAGAASALPVLSRPAEAVPPAAPVTEAPVAGAEAEAVRKALRGLVGCERARLLALSEEERRRCEDRLAAVKAPQLALSRQAEFDAARGGAEPWLVRKPKNGCKVRAAGTVTVMGKEGAAAGIGCAWDF
ncbi:hypothetical protein [Phenylobacterium sp.]|uniref:hypothetical protein n=1 Tax=Phenylobacterium sp. TaxID=1871053 RepID=UPI002F94CF1D